MAYLENGKFVDGGEYKKPTRAQYLNGEVTHEDYYRAIYREAGISFIHCKPADVPRNLSGWDALSIMAKHNTAPVFAAHGDSWSIAGGVCAAKQAAIDAGLLPPK